MIEPLVIEVLYDGYPNEAVAAFCADPPVGLSLKPSRLYRRGFGVPPEIIWVIGVGAVALRGFLDELGRPLGKAIGEDMVRGYGRLRDRLRVLLDSGPSPSVFGLWVDLDDRDGELRIECYLRCDRGQDLDAAFDSFPEILRLIALAREEYPGSKLTTLKFRFDAGRWLLDFKILDDELVPGEHLKTKPQEPEPPVGKA